jgi:hypothetical protein
MTALDRARHTPKKHLASQRPSTHDVPSDDHISETAQGEAVHNITSDVRAAGCKERIPHDWAANDKYVKNVEWWLD